MDFRDVHSAHPQAIGSERFNTGESAMKKLILALSAVAAFSAPALAADMAAKAPMRAAPVAYAPSWTGFYLFGGGGYGLWEADTTTIDPVTGICVLCVEQRQGGRGYFGTVGGGFDWQFGGSWVAGIFGDGQFGNIRGTIQDQGPFSVGQEKLRTSWAAGVRLGYLVAPNVLSYVNGGYSGSNWSGTTLVRGFLGTPIGTGWHSDGFDRSGWFLGGGVENSLNFFGWNAPGWFMKTEYRVAQYDTIQIAQRSDVTGLSVGNNIAFKPIVQTISTSLVYRFNWGGAPIAARY
jgi:outer membrane immunogenic protein